MKQFFVTFSALFATAAVIWLGLTLYSYCKAPRYDNKLSDVSAHVTVDWLGIAFRILVTSVVSVIVSIILEKRKQDSN
jgi:hypothetical protein